MTKFNLPGKPGADADKIERRNKMKHIITLLAIYTIGITSVSAQNTGDSEKQKSNPFRFNLKEKISYEIHAGLNLSHFSTDATDPDVKEAYENVEQGYNLSVLANLPFMESIYFQTGIELKTKSHTQYCISMPVWRVAYRQNITPDLKWHVYLGPQVNFIITNSSHDEYYDAEWCLALGTGLYYKKIYFGVNSDLGLSNRYGGKKNWGPPQTWERPAFDKAYNRTFSLNIGYRF
jgi:hypothetical protein